ncbi:hypothetical protein OG444_32600 [Streptomyces sp. NBC_01232]|uniref:hypothetical protein n=1 Tax=unclassified Streptomyces TaxID=2593676 RepID=UPI002E14044C|nr:hypothetical protein OG444_32600 [Streptomyces sp. NBC_01232]
MPLVVEIILIVIGCVLLVAALIGSGISRRLMTIPKMHRAPRVIVAILGVLLLAGGMWGVSTEPEKHELSLADLKAHIPPDVKASLVCTESAEAPKGAVSANCSTEGMIPEYVWYTMFPDVHSMHAYWVKQTAPESQPGTECNKIDDYKKGSHTEYYLDDASVTVGDLACYVSEGSTVAVYTDRRFNIVVWAEISDPKHFSDFLTWVRDTSQPIGDSDVAPATPSPTAEP